MNWKHEIGRLRDTARPVRVPPPSGMGAREVARVLSGVVSMIARQHGVERMQQTCAELVLSPIALGSRFAQLPPGADSLTEMVAVVCRGLAASATVESVQAALAFWASETDVAEWQSLVAA